MAHALLSPSSAEKWETCSGAIAMEHGLPDSSSQFADEGTAAHFLASECLSGNRHPAEFIGKTIALGSSGAFWLMPDREAPVRSQFRVDIEMAGHVNTYVMAVKQLAVGGELLVEQRIPISQITGEYNDPSLTPPIGGTVASGEVSGTADAVIIQGDELQIHDLKYGMGVRVEAEQNKQLMIYALGALDEYSLLGEFTQCRLFIHQPRVASAPSEWVISVEDLRKYRTHIGVCASNALVNFRNRDKWLGTPEALKYLTPSDKGCKWCKAKADCPALAKFVTDAVGVDFEVLGQADAQIADNGMTVAGSVCHVDVAPATLAAKMSACNLIEDWIKAVRGKVEAELLAGNEVPGYKLVQGRQGPRQWADAEEAETTLKSMRLKQEEMYDFKLISPTSAEKLFGEKGSQPSVKRWNKLAKLITQSEGKPSVAPLSDKRPALVIKPAIEEFEDLTAAPVDDGSDLA